MDTKENTLRRALRDLVRMAGAGYTMPYLASTVWDSL